MEEPTLREAMRLACGDGQVIALDRRYIDLMDGSFKAATLLAQAVYLQRKAHREESEFGDEDGWWYKTQDELEAETMLNGDQQRRVREKLNDREWWSEERRDMTGRLYYKIDLPRLVVQIAEGGGGGGGETRNRDSASPASTRSGSPASTRSGSGAGGRYDAPAHNASASHSQTTTETTNRDTLSPPAREDSDSEDPPTGHSTTEATPDVSTYFDVEREPLPESERWDLMRFQQEWREYIGRQYDVADRIQRERAMCLLAHFRKSEIVDALTITRRKADDPGWSYFRAVLERAAEMDDDGDEYDDPLERWKASAPDGSDKPYDGPKERFEAGWVPGDEEGR